MQKAIGKIITRVTIDMLFMFQAFFRSFLHIIVYRALLSIRRTTSRVILEYGLWLGVKVESEKVGYNWRVKRKRRSIFAIEACSVYL